MGRVRTRTTSGPGLARWICRAAIGAVLIIGLVIGGTAFRVWQVGRVDNRDHADAIVVLGAAQYNGEPSAVLKARLAHAKKLYDAGVADMIVTSGGGMPGDNYTEAESGAMWLSAHGVPARDTVAVSHGRDTLGTLRAVSEAVTERGWSSAVLVSDPWHSLRSRVMARDLGLDAWVSPTHSGPMVRTRETEIRYIIRETGALLYYRMLRTSSDTVDGFGLL